MLHRASHHINRLVDRVLFRRHHAAEESLRRVTAALPFATEKQSIAEALVAEPVRNLELASAALFQRDLPDGPLHRVQARGWSADHASTLAADEFLVRYLQAEHEPLRLDDRIALPRNIPQDAASPVLAIPIVKQHALTASVLYGAHLNHTLPDPDEVGLLHALAKASAVSYQQAKITTLAREVAALTRDVAALRAENAEHKARNDRLQETLTSLAQERGVE